ncbi:hypothetical protein [Piscirickettsia salmonis]|uniref:hypothetical protein n=1 Tax=Piscirickettsia salmonis TaxID=1238 RepID=UPI0009B8E662|nr:hypothetical protein [Piscirickettsia salmonis]
MDVQNTYRGSDAYVILINKIFNLNYIYILALILITKNKSYINGAGNLCSQLNGLHWHGLQVEAITFV